MAAAAAAAGNPIRDLCQEASCPICLDYFRDPVTIAECGHNFCRGCLTECWGESAEEGPCPQCRQTGQRRTLVPNRQLANFVELARKLSLRGGERVCEKHQEPLKLFCKEDKSPICVVCDKAKEHRGHQVVPVEEAAQERKEKVAFLLVLLRIKGECILENQAETKKKSEDLLMHTKAAREKTVVEFRQLHQFLEEQEKLLLAQMEEVEKEIVSKREEHLARLSKDFSTLGSLIEEIEENIRKPASEFLQDIQNTIERSKTQEKLDDDYGDHDQDVDLDGDDLHDLWKSHVKKSTKDSCSNLWQSQICPVKWRTWEFCDISSFLEGVMKQFKGMLASGHQLQKANVTLDPETAHPQFILSANHKSVRIGPKCQDLPPNPKRFDHHFFVLGCEEFTTGRYFWDVTPERSNDWAVGVARKSVRRKGKFGCGPGEGFWAVGKCKGEHTIPDFTYVTGDISTIRVSLNCPGGCVTFYNAETADLLSVISGVSFSGESVHPFFYLGQKGSCLAPFSGSFKPVLTLSP